MKSGWAATILWAVLNTALGIGALKVADTKFNVLIVCALGIFWIDMKLRFNELGAALGEEILQFQARYDPGTPQDEQSRIEAKAILDRAYIQRLVRYGPVASVLTVAAVLSMLG